jgi:DNA-binding GntR family transcriptional regulator
MELKKLILSGELSSSDLLTERMLAAKLDMSRTPIRSAIERLDSEGFITYTPNKGIFISQISLQQVTDFFDFRMALEPYVVKKLAQTTISEETATWFKENLKGQEKCVSENNFTSFTDLDSEFHKKLVSIYGNQEIISTMERLQDRLNQIALSVLKKDNARIHASYNDHLHIWNCIVKKESDDASAEMLQHLEFGKRILLL